MITDEAARYIVNWYIPLLTDVEQKALNHLHATMKATHGRSDLAAQNEARDRIHLRHYLSDDPEVLSLVQHGYEFFVLQTATRIITANPDKVQFNNCPQCGALARTPKAKQCRSCGFDWH